MRTVKNLDTGNTKRFNTDHEFLQYAREVYKENESQNPYPSTIHWMPDCISNALEYIEEYCGDLQLNEY